MGMPIIATASINRDDAITDIIQSVALEQASISHILNAEGEKLQKIINKENVTHDELIEVNNCVKSIIESISKLEIILQSKLALLTEQHSNKEETPFITSGTIVREENKPSVIINPGQPILWNYINSVGDKDNYSLNEESGEIILRHKGIYSIDWILNIEGAMSFYPEIETDEISLSVKVSNKKGKIYTYPVNFPMIITGLACGQCLIQTTEENTTISLINYYKNEKDKVILALANHTDNQGSLKINASYKL